MEAVAAAVAAAAAATEIAVAVKTAQGRNLEEIKRRMPNRK